MTINKSQALPIILASGSPRRKELLGLSLQLVARQFEVYVPEVDESPLRGESPRAMVGRLAHLKAMSCAASVKTDALYIGSDTIVVTDKNKILGKPLDAGDAKRLLSLISGRAHHVYTGYCVLERREGRAVKTVKRIVRTTVHMRKLSRTQIANYVASGEPLDKAGAYAAQGMGMGFIERISGSYTNVVGLPMSQLMHDLESVFKAFE